MAKSNEVIRHSAPSPHTQKPDSVYPTQVGSNPYNPICVPGFSV